MAISEVLSRSISEAASPASSDPAAAPKDADTPSAGSKAMTFFLALMIALVCAAGLGYTQWWVPRQEAQAQVAKMRYDHCLEEVKVYKGKKSYKGRVAQCSKFLSD